MNLRLEDDEVKKRINENELVRILAENEEYERSLRVEEQLEEVKLEVKLTTATAASYESGINGIHKYLSNRNATN